VGRRKLRVDRIEDKTSELEVEIEGELMEVEGRKLIKVPGI
jgi:RNase P/RNase MRP subunit p29